MSIVTPHNEKNAIKIAAFAFEFSEPINKLVIENAISLYEADKDMSTALPSKKLRQTLTIQIGGSQPPSPHAPEDISGVLFSSIKPSGDVKWSVELSSEALIITCGDYTRWDEVWKETLVYFSKFATVLSGQKISLVTLEYQDEFIIDNTQEGDWKDALFNKKTKYLSKNIFEINDFWHSHNGFFQKGPTTGLRILNLINVDYRQEEGVLKAIIQTQHKSLLDDFLSVAEEEAQEKINTIIEENHAINKSIFLDLLSEEMCDSINLKVDS
jgi:uncharacterized protein (TIGR04255 family)